MKLTHLNPSDLPDWSSFFSQVVIAEGSPLRIVVVSGQVGVDGRQAVAGDGGLAAQADRAFANVVVALSAAGCSTPDVAKLTVYVAGYEEKDAGVIREALTRHFGGPPFPACTLLGVQALARPEFLIEVEALAISAAR
jgi:enamine deaminase RidA (YjgF/YER057c/UK114 family)